MARVRGCGNFVAEKFFHICMRRKLFDVELLTGPENV